MSYSNDDSPSKKSQFYEANSSPPEIQRRSPLRNQPSPLSRRFNNAPNLSFNHPQDSDTSLAPFHSASSLPLKEAPTQNLHSQSSTGEGDYWISSQLNGSPGSQASPKNTTTPLLSSANENASSFSMASPYAYYSAYASQDVPASHVQADQAQNSEFQAVRASPGRRGSPLRENYYGGQRSPAHQSIRSVQSIDLEDCTSETNFPVSPSPMIRSTAFEEAQEDLDPHQNEIKREAQSIEPLARRPENRLSQLAPTREEVEKQQLSQSSSRDIIREDAGETDDSTDKLEEVEEEDEDNSLSILNSLPTPRVPSSRLPSGSHPYRAELGGNEGFMFPATSLPSQLTATPTGPLESASPSMSSLRQDLGPPMGGEYTHASYGSQSTSEGSSKGSFGDSPRLAPQRPRSAMLPGRKRQSYYDFGGSGAPSLINLSLADAVANEQGPTGINALLPRMKTIELYRKNAKKSNDPELEFQLAQYMMQTALIASSQRREKAKSTRSKSVDATPLGTPGSTGTQESAVSGNSAGKASTGSTVKAGENLDGDRIIANIFKDAMNSLKRLSEHGHADAQYLLGDIYSSPAVNNAPDMEKSFKYFSMAGKHNHAEAAYRAALCLQEGWGTNRDAGRALQFYRSAAVRNQPGALYQLGMAYFYGGMGLPDNSANRQAGVKWLGRAVNASNTTFNRAPYELGKIFEVGYKDLVIPDGAYSAKLYSRASDLGFIPASARLGRAYEFGELGCPQDPSLSIHYFTIAALGNDPTAQLSMCAWYVVGAGPSFPVNLDEAYEWCLRSALNGLPKAQYTLAYFLENGTGTQRDIIEASRWYRTAAANGYEKAIKRVKELGLANDEKSKGKCTIM